MGKKKKIKAKHILFLSDDEPSEYIFDNKDEPEAEELDNELDIIEQLYLQKKERSHKLTKEIYERDIEEL